MNFDEKESKDVSTVLIKDKDKDKVYKKNKKINQKDLEIIINDIIINYNINNEDIMNLDIKESLVEMIKLLYESVNCNNDLSELDNMIHKLLDYRIKVSPPSYTDNDLNKINSLIDNLKKIPQPAQRTPEWYEFRENRLTASDLATAIDKNPYSTRSKLILNKCGIKEDWNPGPAIIHGVKYEDVAVMIYSLRNDVIVKEYGCIPHPNLKCFGASPDGIVDTDSENKNFIGRMLEIKCPTQRPITGFVPKYYYYQVQGQLEVCDLDYCDFLECKIVEYNSEDEYFLDGDFEYTNDNKEKGILIELHDYSLEKSIYKYADYGISYDDYLIWSNNIIESVLDDDNLEYIQTSFWRLEEYSCILLNRNRELWSNIEPKILKFWDDVLHYREKGCDEINQPPKKKQRKIKKDTLLFLDDSD